MFTAAATVLWVIPACSIPIARSLNSLRNLGIFVVAKFRNFSWFSVWISYTLQIQLITVQIHVVNKAQHELYLFLLTASPAVSRFIGQDNLTFTGNRPWLGFEFNMIKFKLWKFNSNFKPITLIPFFFCSVYKNARTFKILCNIYFSIIFSSIGVVSSLQWVWSFLTPSSRVQLIQDHGSECMQGNISKCPWASAFVDLGNRLQVLELAFKEQSETSLNIEKGLYNQSALNLFLNRKLEVFMNRLDEISQECHHLEGRVGSMSSRLLADGKVFISTYTV